MSTKPNRLEKESSPYLRQHAHNPVDWYPWGSEALDKARRDKKPIFLSIGYSACHWCHVMERESFEDAETAEILNRDFISIKVDREERPDLDHIYMSAVQALTQHGGWPLSVFLTPQMQPFYGGTYFPPEDRHGMPAFKKILTAISQAWTTKPLDVIENAKRLTQALKDMQGMGPTRGTGLSLDLLDDAYTAILRSFDTQFGGLGSAPKFFHSMAFRVLLRHWKRTGDNTALQTTIFTLDHLARGGIRDQLGGGFHRYSTDPEWLAPHFEKMLYDNALLTELYLEAHLATGKPAYARVASNTLDYLLREMLSPEGGFYSTQDADSEGVEGKFYVWKRDEVLKLLGDELGEAFCRSYDIQDGGNWEGVSIPRIVRPAAEVAMELGVDEGALEELLATARRKLYTERAKRVAPARDEKILLSWNGLALSAFALGHQVIGDGRYLEAAQNCARFLLKEFQPPQTLASGKPRFLHSRKDGLTRFNGYLDDYAFLLNGLLQLYESDFDPQWVTAALSVADGLLEQFWDAKEQAFYFTGADHETLITRPKEIQDGATPSGQSVAVTALLKLSRLTGQAQYEDVARASLQEMEPYLKQIPTGVSQMLIALDLALQPSQEWVLFPGDDKEAYEDLLSQARALFTPHRTFAAPFPGAKSPVTLLEHRSAERGEPTLYFCENQTCLAPLVGAPAIQSEFDKWKTATKPLAH